MDRRRQEKAPSCPFAKPKGESPPKEHSWCPTADYLPCSSSPPAHTFQHMSLWRAPRKKEVFKSFIFYGGGRGIRRKGRVAGYTYGLGTLFFL